MFEITGNVWLDAWSLLRDSSPLGFIFSAVIGAALGSFANVVIWRLPRGQSLIRPASHCPHCSAPIPARHNIPILSYLLLGGRAACCGQPISPRYPIVELLGALILGTLYLLEGWTATFLFESAWMILLLILAAIDVEHFRLPNSLVGVGLALSVLWMAIAPPQSWVQAGLGLLAGLVLALAAMAVGKVLKGRWSGLGDVKLAVVLGFTFGPGRFVFLYAVAALTALIYAAAFRRRIEGGRIPMGPFFALGVWITIWCGEEVVRWYVGLIR